jgi:hypothetical protein
MAGTWFRMHLPLVVLNVFQDNVEPLLIMLKQVQHDERQDDGERLRGARSAAQPR